MSIDLSQAKSATLLQVKSIKFRTLIRMNEILSFLPQKPALATAEQRSKLRKLLPEHFETIRDEVFGRYNNCPLYLSGVASPDPKKTIQEILPVETTLGFQISARNCSAVMGFVGTRDEKWSSIEKGMSENMTAYIRGYGLHALFIGTSNNGGKWGLMFQAKIRLSFSESLKLIDYLEKGDEQGVLGNTRSYLWFFDNAQPKQ